MNYKSLERLKMNLHNNSISEKGIYDLCLPFTDLKQLKFLNLDLYR